MLRKLACHTRADSEMGSVVSPPGVFTTWSCPRVEFHFFSGKTDMPQ
jgi:hypothetical protein